LFSAAQVHEQTLETSMRKIVILAAMAASLFVAACNTVEGAGKDVSAAGHAVTNTAEDAKH
jgi:predicted small secreted protein